MLYLENVSLNDKKTKYVFENKEYERKSNCKINKFEMYNVGFYKGVNASLKRLGIEEKGSEYRSILSENKKSKEKALLKGSVYHLAIEQSLKSKNPYDSLRILSQDNPFARWLIDNFNQEQINSALSEMPFIYDENDISYGGTVDLIINNTLIDFKTGKKYYEEHLIDASAYYYPLKGKFKLKKVIYLYENELGFEVSDIVEYCIFSEEELNRGWKAFNHGYFYKKAIKKVEVLGKARF